MTIEEYKRISPVFEEDIYDAISLKTCVEKRETIGAPGRATGVIKIIIENLTHVKVIGIYISVYLTDFFFQFLRCFFYGRKC